MKNKLIVFEAINAAGKTTQFNFLTQAFKKRGYTVHAWHFNQRDFPTGQLIEHKFLHDKKKRGRFSRREQALLYIQDFYTQSEEIKQLQKKPGQHIVLLDRFYTSTMAYQTIGLTGQRRRDMLQWIKWLCEEGKPSLPKPDQVILLDTPINISLKHLSKSKADKDYFENKQRLAALRRSYLRLAKEEGWTVINSVNDRGQQRSISDIHQEIWHTIAGA